MDKSLDCKNNWNFAFIYNTFFKKIWEAKESYKCHVLHPEQGSEDGFTPLPLICQRIQEGVGHYLGITLEKENTCLAW